MDHVLARRGQRTTIVVATSGDTGGAAVEAFANLDNVDLVVLFPHGRISEVQQRMMTTTGAANVHALAVEGTFDDCQAIVKAMFNHHRFRDRVALSGVNSINWARIVAQTVYYYTAAGKLGLERPNFAVPTGNFGDIFAGFAALKMGLPMGKLAIATNENDILARALHTGRYEPREVTPTDSPSMDIQISSNFERLLFEASGRDAAAVKDAMAALREKGSFVIEPAALEAIRERFSAHRVTRGEASAAMSRLYADTGIVIDPHTAVGLAAARREQTRSKGPTVVLGTAHPAKFPDAVRRAIGREPEIPAALQRCLEGVERFDLLPGSAAPVAAYIDARATNGGGAKRSL
jgi:threonine synthase